MPEKPRFLPFLPTRKTSGPFTAFQQHILVRQSDGSQVQVDSGRRQSIGRGIMMIKLKAQMSADIVEPVMRQAKSAP